MKYKKLNNKGLSNLVVIAIGLTLFLSLSAIGYFIYSRNKTPQSIENINKVSNITNPSTEIKTINSTNIVFDKSDEFEVLRSNLSSDRIEILNSIENDLYTKWETLSDSTNPEFKIFRYRLISLRYLKNQNYEVALSARVSYAARDEKSIARPSGSGSECLFSKSTKPNSKWDLVECSQNLVDCKELDKLGLNNKQTIDWGCFDYEKQVERK